MGFNGISLSFVRDMMAFSRLKDHWFSDTPTERNALLESLGWR